MSSDQNPEILTCGAFSGSTQQTSCPLCPHPPSPSLIFRKANGVGIWQCPHCEIMYASPRFTEKSLLAIYENSSFISEDYHEKFRNWSYARWKQSEDTIYTISKLKTELIEHYIAPESRILDVGCAMGLFCLEAQQQGYLVEGLEPSNMLAKIGRDIIGVTIHNTQLEDFKPENKYGAIVLWDVLEHVYDPLRLVNRCRDMMEQDGFLFIQVPNFEGVSARLKTFLCRVGIKKSDFKHFGFPWHIYSFNRNSLTALLRSAGFEPRAFQSWSHHLKQGKKSPMAKAVSTYVKERCLSDYIVCVAQKKG